MISVIVVTYNHEQTIARTLDSVLGQQCRWPIEIVIGEDCSTDRTRDICTDYAHQYPEQIRLFCNERIDNYFDCLLQCRGKYIADCAGDDFWIDPLKLEKELAIMENHPEVTLVHTAWQYFDERSQTAYAPPPLPYTAPLTNGKDMLEALITQTRLPIIHLCTALYRADTIRREYEANPTLFRNPEMGCEDLQIAFIMAYNGQIAFLPDVTLNYSQGHPSVSNASDERRLFKFTKRVTTLSHYLSNNYGICNKNTESYFRYRIFALAMHAFRAHDQQLATEAEACQKLWEVEADQKTQLLFQVMKREWLWQPALAFRRLAVCVKHLTAHH